MRGLGTFYGVDVIRLGEETPSSGFKASLLCCSVLAVATLFVASSAAQAAPESPVIIPPLPADFFYPFFY